jgi:oligogalacturonide lyase
MSNGRIVMLYKLSFCLLLLSALARGQTTAPALPNKVQTTPIPAEFKDPETGLRIVHLSRYPTDYGSVIYFTYNTFSPDSRYTLVNAQFKDKWRHLYCFDFDTMTTRPLETERPTQSQVVSKTGKVYYLADNAAWVVPLQGGKVRKLADIPARWCPGVGLTVNADETLLLGGSSDIDKSAPVPATAPHVLYTINIQSGEVKVVHRDTINFGHVQFSPTDPDLCMFCWEGTWDKVDRIWFINPSKSTTDANGKVKANARVAFHRTEPGEMVGHEFWQPDGKAIWFQHGVRGRPDPRGQGLTRMDVATGALTRFYIPRGFTGIHQSWSPDGTFMISDGGGAKGDTKPGPGKYLSKLTLPADGSDLLRGEHLVTMGTNDYAMEPNPHVSPDNRWVTFTATLHGTPQAYAVELRRK